MGTVEKRIQVNNGKINYFKSDGLYKNREITYTIVDKDGKPVKKLQLTRDSNFRFSAWANDERNNVAFTIYKDNPIYEPINNFLNHNKDIIKDENEEKLDDHIIHIQKGEEKVRIIFTDKDKTEQNDFNVSIATDFKKDDPREEKLKRLFDDMDLALYPRGALEDILVPANVFGKLKLKPEQEERIFKIIPELKETVGFEQNNPWHIYDVWNHTKKALEKSKAESDIRVALLLHDIGKPHSYQDDENGIRHFEGHAQKSAEIARPILQRLEYEPKEIEDICYIIENHSKIINLENVNKSNLDINRKLLSVQYSDAYGYNPVYTQPVVEKLDKIKDGLIMIKNRKEKTNENSKENDEPDEER